MKFSTVPTILTTLTTLTAAQAQGDVLITFLEAANVQFRQSFPTDGTVVPITNPLSVTDIMSNTGQVQCVFNGIDRSVTTVTGAEIVDVGPPQTQISGACHAI